MEGSYAVYLGTKPVGKVIVQRQGLYYRFKCRCKLEEGILCRLQISCGNMRENLGIPVPVNGGFELDTKVPVKRLMDDEPEFHLVPKHEKTAGQFIPIYPEEPFGYISRLKEAYLTRKDGQLGIIVKQNRSA